MEGEVEVDDQGAPGRIAAEIGAFGRIDQVAPGAIGLRAVGRVTERDEQAAGVTGHPEDGQAARTARQRDLDPADAAELEVVAAAFGQLQGDAGRAGKRAGAGERAEARKRAGAGGRLGRKDDLGPKGRIVFEMAGLERGARLRWDGRLWMLPEESLPDRSPVRQRDRRIVGGHPSDFGVEGGDLPSPICEPGKVRGGSVALGPVRHRASS